MLEFNVYLFYEIADQDGNVCTPLMIAQTNNLPEIATFLENDATSRQRSSGTGCILC